MSTMHQSWSYLVNTAVLLTASVIKSQNPCKIENLSSDFSLKFSHG